MTYQCRKSSIEKKGTPAVAKAPTDKLRFRILAGNGATTLQYERLSLAILRDAICPGRCALRDARVLTVVLAWFNCCSSPASVALATLKAVSARSTSSVVVNPLGRSGRSRFQVSPVCLTCACACATFASAALIWYFRF